MKDERSFEVHLNNLIEFHESGGYWTGHKAQMKWKTSEGERSVLLTKSGLGGFEQWVDAIKKAKENRVLITQQQSKRKYCMKCGNQLTLEAEFCTKCGTILNINQIGNLKEQSIMITQEKGENPPLLKSIVKEKERSIGSVNLEQIGKLKEIADLSEMIKTNEKTIDILKMRYKKGEIDKGTYEKETSEISNEIIETRSNLQNLYSKFALSEEDFIMEYSKTLRLLDSLNNRLVEGAISEEIYKKFYAEFQMKLDNLREIIKIETSDLQLEITKLEVEKASKNKEIEELKARQMIRQITDEEYERKRKPLDDGIQKMVIEFTSKQERLQRFKGLI